MGVNEENSPSSKLTIDVFQEIFEKFEPGVQILSFKEAQGSGRGDNYTATLYRVHLKGLYNSTHDGKKLKWERTVICKRLPECAARRDAFKSVELFRNEIEFYTTIIPELTRFQKARTKDVFKAMPKCYLAKNNLLIMEDLATRGFQMAKRQKGLSVEQTEAVLKEIAKLHSLSLAYKQLYPKQFEKLTKLITEGIFSTTNEEWYKNYYIQLTRNAVNMVTDILPKNSKYVQRLLEFTESSTFFSRMIDMVSTESPVSVICHGDCWTNNFMYRYDSLGNVIETALVDFQCIRYGSPALDISNLIFCCTSKATRDKHLESFLALYASELYKCLIMLDVVPKFCDSPENCLKMLKEELRTYGKFAMGLAMDIIPISTCESEDAPDLYIGKTDEPTGAPELNFPPNDLCRQKMSEILTDLVDLDML